jgi:hypothetical protein
MLSSIGNNTNVATQWTLHEWHKRNGGVSVHHIPAEEIQFLQQESDTDWSVLHINHVQLITPETLYL